MTYLRGVRANRGSTLAVTDINNFLSITDTAILINDNLSIIFSASIIDNSNLTSAKGASIFNNSNLTSAKGASIFDNSNLTESKLQSILDNTNLTIQKGQEILDEMSNPSKIGTGGRRGYLADDWNDNKITSRDNAATLPTSFDKIFQNFRPEWSGGLVSDGNFKLTNDNQRECCSSTITVGTWEVDYYVTGTSNFRGALMYNMYKDANNYYLLYNRIDKIGFDFQKCISGSTTTLIDNDVLGLDSTWENMAVTRDINGNFEIFLEGTSRGTVTDTDLTESNNLYLGCISLNDTYFDNLKVY